MSRELPILFNTEMVQAILDGKKSCTRRICKDGNEYTVPDMDFYDPEKRTYAVHNYADKEHTDKLSIAERTCPICPGDILYVRETFIQAAAHTFWYKADDKSWMSKDLLWKPSIHMPKEAARIWLKVTDVRVERLQEITAESALTEGADKYIRANGTLNEDQTITSFIGIWNNTIKKSDIDRYGWDASPWVWVIEFGLCDKPSEPYQQNGE